MKLIPVIYQGFTAMDRRFSSPMLPWIVSEIRKRNSCEKLSLGVEEGVLQAYDQDFELQFSHQVALMTRFSQADLDPCTFLYLLKDEPENLLYCYLFVAKKHSDVTDLYKQIKDQSYTPTRSVSSAANLTSLCVDISPSCSNFFEVLYIGKIKVWQKKVPDSFVDDALVKFEAYEAEKKRKRTVGSIGRLKSESDIMRRGSTDSSSDDSTSTPAPTHPLIRSHSVHSNLIKAQAQTQQNQILETLASISEKEKIKEAEDHQTDDNDEKSDRVSNDNNNGEEKERNDKHNNNRECKENSKCVNLDDHNRTMVLQIDRTDLRLISPDRKVILLHKQHKDVTTCIQGQKQPEHFGFICKEGTNTFTFVGYVFKCESASIATDAMAAITQAFLNTESKPKQFLSSCEHCPMVWYHKLCVEIENMTDRKTQAAIFRRIEQLDDDEQSVILTKFRGAETDSVREQNEFLMMLLRAHCESKQARHVHDTAENRSEFLNQYLGGGTIFTKAKRSLSNSFDQLLKRRASKDDLGGSLRAGLNLAINREPSPNTTDHSDKDSDYSGPRSRSSTVGSHTDLNTNTNAPPTKPPSPEKTTATPAKSPMIDIFLKIGNTANNPPATNSQSWRQSIFKRVLTSTPTPTTTTINDDIKDDKKRKYTKKDYRLLWKKSIYHTILLIRMEKENTTIRLKQEESAVKRIKLEYDDLRVDQRELEVFDMLSNKNIKPDPVILLQAIRQGVPRSKRGDLWLYLYASCKDASHKIDSHKYPDYNTPYRDLLKQLTSHQHAILIDLGRTFPTHSYYTSPLGPGQLALFNLLKAYSLLDPDVGYCQGLSFVAGVLLLHVSEPDAFELLKHLMFRRGMRAQYLPDMRGLRVRLYQLSRLVHDRLSDVWELFDRCEVEVSLYAAPWLLTVFASQFPLGFVTRVFDLIFLEGPDAIFKIALSLLTHHRQHLLECDTFESIMTYLKTTLPHVTPQQLESIFKHAYINDYTKQLNEYKVEYQVLQEEFNNAQPQIEIAQKLATENRSLKEENRLLQLQLEASLSNVQRLEKTRVLQQSQLNKLEMKHRTLDVTVSTLSEFINRLIDSKVDVVIPNDVQRILSQVNFNERLNCNNGRNVNLLKQFQKSQSMGLINVSGKESSVIDSSRNRVRTNSGGESKYFSSNLNNILHGTLNNNSNNNNNNNNNNSKSGIDIIIDSDIDSGLATPVSPVNTSSSNVQGVDSTSFHPLSNCDVVFSYQGTRELKRIKK